MINLALFLIYFLLLVLAVLRVARLGKGIEVPVWILVIAVVPILGMISAFVHYKKWDGREEIDVSHGI